MSSFYRLTRYAHDAAGIRLLDGTEELEIAFNAASLEKGNPRRIYDLVVDELEAAGCLFHWCENERMQEIVFRKMAVGIIHDHPQNYCQIAISDALYWSAPALRREGEVVQNFKNRNDWRAKKKHFIRGVYSMSRS